MAITRLTTCNNPMEAHLLQGRLEEEGIHSFLGGELMSGYPPMNGVSVFVEEEDYSMAHTLLQNTSEL